MPPFNLSGGPVAAAPAADLPAAPAVPPAPPAAAAPAPVSPAPVANAAPSPAAAAVPASAPVAAAVVPSGAAPASGQIFGLAIPHLIGAGFVTGGGAAVAYLAGEIQPVIHWAVTGGIPDATAEKSLSTLAALAVLSIAGLVAKFTRGRAGTAANS